MNYKSVTFLVGLSKWGVIKHALLIVKVLSHTPGTALKSTLLPHSQMLLDSQSVDRKPGWAGCLPAFLSPPFSTVWAPRSLGSMTAMLSVLRPRYPCCTPWVGWVLRATALPVRRVLGSPWLGVLMLWMVRLAARNAMRPPCFCVEAGGPLLSCHLSWGGFLTHDLSDYSSREGEGGHARERKQHKGANKWAICDTVGPASRHSEGEGQAMSNTRACAHLLKGREFTCRRSRVHLRCAHVLWRKGRT